jgi:hypothetical protein
MEHADTSQAGFISITNRNQKPSADERKKVPNAKNPKRSRIVSFDTALGTEPCGFISV